MRVVFVKVATLLTIAALSAAANVPALASTYDLPLNGTISIDSSAGSTGQTAIQIQAIENFSLPVYNPWSLQNTVGVYQWISSFSVDQNGTPVSEPTLSPFGTALTGYGQNCSTGTYCPHPSGESSETILSGTLFITGNATLDVSTLIYGTNILSDNLELVLTLPSGFTVESPSATPLPASLPLFATGLGFVVLFAWNKKRKMNLAA
jgi:hypothetical protein